jgi:hypothetical protein
LFYGKSAQGHKEKQKKIQGTDLRFNQKMIFVVLGVLCALGG